MRRQIEIIRNSNTVAAIRSVWNGTMPLRKLLLISAIAFIVYFNIERTSRELLDKNIHEFNIYFRYIDLPASFCFLFVYLGLWRALKIRKDHRIRRTTAKVIALVFIVFCILNILSSLIYLGANEKINNCKVIAARNRPTKDFPYSGYWINYCGSSGLHSGELIKPSTIPGRYVVNGCDIAGEGGGWTDLKIPGDPRYYIKVISNDKIAIKVANNWLIKVRSLACPLRDTNQ